MHTWTLFICTNNRWQHVHISYIYLWYIYIHVHISFTVLRPLWELSARLKTTTIGQKAVRETDVSRQHGGSIDGPSKIPRTSSHYRIERGPQLGTRHAKTLQSFEQPPYFVFSPGCQAHIPSIKAGIAEMSLFQSMQSSGMCFQNCTQSGMCFCFQNCTQKWMCSWVSFHWTGLSGIPFNLVQYTFHVQGAHFKRPDLKGQ